MFGTILCDQPGGAGRVDDLEAIADAVGDAPTVPVDGSQRRILLELQRMQAALQAGLAGDLDEGLLGPALDEANE